MNKNKKKTEDDYKQLQMKIFSRAAVMPVAAVIIVFLVYKVFLHKNFANVFVKFLEKFIYGDRDVALKVYQYAFRNNIDLLLMIAIFLVFLLMMWIYLKRFKKYFNEINRGIDALIEENSGEVVLPSELSVTEKKINFIKHTLEKRKLDLKVTEQRKNDLVMYLAHDLKTPLASVIGYLTLLRDENQISDELREKYLSISLDKAERLEDLINEFFEITRFNLSNISLVYRKINLTRLLEQLAYEFKPMLAEKNLKCEFEIQQDIMLSCDADKLQRVFDNLLRNAVSYCYENTNIKVTAEQIENHVLIKIINEGDTIPKERLDRIFEQFYRLDTSRSSSTGGAGLGLAIAKEIVELHHGQIFAHSENGSTCFEVTLPLVGKS